MKRNKLYTVNKWNQPAFVDRTYQNIYDGFGTSFLNSANSAVGEGGIKGALSFGGIGGLGSSLGSAAGNMLKGGLSGIGSAVGGAVGNLIGGGYESGVGNALGSLGKVASVIPGPWGAAISGGLQVLGGGVNALWGTKVDEAKLKANQEGTNTLLNFASNASSLDDVKGITASSNVQDAYSGGVFKKGWAEQKNAQIRKFRNDALAFADRSVGNNIFNLTDDQMNNALANYSAYGGPVDTVDNNMSAIDYDFMDRYMTAKERQNELKNKVSNTPSMPVFMQNGFAFGGDLQTNGADFPTKLTHINAGGSHSENPNDGVQMGVDPEGTPNLVEEGETVYNDYVFSNRIMADEATKQVFKLPRKKDITFADISKRLEKEIAERPADPISQAGFEAQMQKLQEQQERQKQEMEAERAKAAFEALSPEEQTTLMQQRAQQEAMAQRAAQEQAMAEQQAAMQQVTPEELAMAQQAQVQTDGTQAMVGQGAPMMAEGGKVNKFAKGGNKRNAGTWKKGTSKENWDRYSRNGLRDFLLKVNDDISNANTEEEKNQIRENAIKTVRGIQSAYADAYQNNLTPSEVNEKVRALQKAFQDAGGNAYFGDIAENINLPKGHNTEDTEEKGWVDGLWGPRTSIRNWGSTEYGDDYDDIRQLASEAGLTYAPGQYKYGDNTLYELGMAQPDVAAVTDPELVVDYGDASPEETVLTTSTTAPQTPSSEESGIVPRRRWEGLRYAGLFGPAVGLGMQALGIGRPDTSGIDAAVNAANGPVAQADWMPIGDYMAYKPNDPWFYTSPIIAQSNATQRSINNTIAPSRNAASLANSYNTMIALGKAQREQLDSNYDRYAQSKGFNRGTNQFNAQSYNQNQQFNADARNRARQYGAQMALQGATQKMDADAGWYNGLYGNVAGLFKGLGDIGRENVATNWRNALTTAGAFGAMDEDELVRADISKYKNGKKSAKGGKIKKGKRGLTI